MKKSWLPALAMLLGFPVAAMANDDNQEAMDRAFDIAFNATIASGYIDGGEDLANGRPSARFTIEPSYGHFFAGVKLASVHLSDPPDRALMEAIFYGGLRFKLEQAELEFAAGHKIYPGLPDMNQTFVSAQAEIDLNEKLSLETEVEYGFQERSWDAKAGLEFSVFEKSFVFAALGRGFGEDVTYWNAGWRYRFNDHVSAKLAYHGAQGNFHTVIASLSFDTSLARLAGNGRLDGD